MIQLSNRKAESVICCLYAASERFQKQGNPLAAAEADCLRLEIRKQLRANYSKALSRSRATRNAKKPIA